MSPSPPHMTLAASETFHWSADQAPPQAEGCFCCVCHVGTQPQARVWLCTRECACIWAHLAALTGVHAVMEPRGDVAAHLTQKHHTSGFYQRSTQPSSERETQRQGAGGGSREASGYLLVNVPVKPQGLLATVGWLKVADDAVVIWAAAALFASGNWKTNFGEGVPPLRSPLCFRGPIS